MYNRNSYIITNFKFRIIIFILACLVSVFKGIMSSFLLKTTIQQKIFESNIEPTLWHMHQINLKLL